MERDIKIAGTVSAEDRDNAYTSNREPGSVLRGRLCQIQSSHRDQRNTRTDVLASIQHDQWRQSAVVVAWNIGHNSTHADQGREACQ